MTTAADAPLFIAHALAAADPRPRLATLLGADFSALSITPSRADRAPTVVRDALERFAPWDARNRLDLAAFHVADIGDAGAVRMAWPDAFAAIVEHAGRALDEQAFTVALGGDHSVTWPLVAAAAERCARVGIIQLDVHHDVRPLDDGPSNGTPIRGLVGDEYVAPGDVVQVGIHPFANRRHLTDWCDEQGIHRHSLGDVATHGPAAIAADALAALDGCDAIWLTVDIDVLDRAFAPGTVAALPGGLSPAQLAALVDAICLDPRVRAMDVVEFDPSRDVASVTAWNAALVVMQALSAVARRGRKAQA